MKNQFSILSQIMTFILYTFQGPRFYLTDAEITQLTRDAKAAIDRAREINNKAEKEKRDLTSEEKTNYEAAMNDRDWETYTK